MPVEEKVSPLSRQGVTILPALESMEGAECMCDRLAVVDPAKIYRDLALTV